MILKPTWMKKGLGGTMSYPCSDHGFWRVMPLTEELAMAWIKTVMPDMVARKFTNKVAVIVNEGLESNEPTIWAVYKHDFRWWLIAKQLRGDDYQNYNWSDEHLMKIEDCRHRRKA